MEVSAKYRGAFCEAKVTHVEKCVKCKVCSAIFNYSCCLVCMSLPMSALYAIKLAITVSIWITICIYMSTIPSTITACYSYEWCHFLGQERIYASKRIYASNTYEVIRNFIKSAINTFTFDAFIVIIFIFLVLHINNFLVVVDIFKSCMEVCTVYSVHLQVLTNVIFY